ncbi:uncharacterized protein LOC111001641 isoform X2 [Pieris rapae]|uniref:uncharacterized protein LOC111001641 isoform X2 n=1 Tax=Pieris rapae TaxID=64459 RepID=UPI001E280165|nr:uncharacterized protein LOC111001641 isoform X2 [Pieris rapae]
MDIKYEVKTSDKLGRYLVAAKDIRSGERILADQPFVLGPSSDTSLVCFNCYLPLINKFFVCKFCAVAPICPGDGCPEGIAKWHVQKECDFFRELKLNINMSPIKMVQNVGSLLTLRALLQRDNKLWDDFMKLETHLDQRRNSSVWEYYQSTVNGTALRQEHLLMGKYFQCTCERCLDATELGTHMSSALCPACKTGFITKAGEKWQCHHCKEETDDSVIGFKVKCCEKKLDVINKKDEKELEEYIRNVSLVLAPNHYLLIDAKQRLAGVIRDAINREPRPTKKMMRRKLNLCEELLPVLEVLSPGICRTKAITMYELHLAIVQLAKKEFDSREITGPKYLDELLNAEKYLKRSIEMLLIEPGNSPEGELCAKALEQYRMLKGTMATVLDGIHEEGKVYVTEIDEERLNDVD